ncbi:hypothetical protein [Reichenbachiella versicolor]|uniref:hypothetical protein n=1 Tax=Reichenbachiella versicolor TaxID=1821036 RepID=UPI000D6DFE9B|nr:hypothetical protein [Reichenbachiella versicolor]
MKYQSYLTLLFALLTLSCDEDNALHTNTADWKPIDDVSYEVRNALNLGGSTFLVGSNLLTTVSLNTANDSLDITKNIVSYSSLFNPHEYSISKDYTVFIEARTNGVYISSMNTSSDPLWVSISQFDQLFTDFEVWQGRQQVGAAISDNTIMIPYNESSSSVHFKVLLIELGNSDEISIEDHKIIEIDNVNSYTNFIRGIFMFGDNFYLNDAESCIQVSKDGSQKVVCNASFENMFEYNGEIYGVPFNGGVYKSLQGTRWNQVMTSSLEIINGYTQVEDELIGYDHSKLIQLTIENDSIILNDITTASLKDYQINCIGTIGTRHVILGTQSGALKINWNSFISLLK